MKVDLTLAGVLALSLCTGTGCGAASEAPHRVLVPLNEEVVASRPANSTLLADMSMVTASASCADGLQGGFMYFPMTVSIGHRVGYLEWADDWGVHTWATNVSSEARGHMWYGPYTRDFGYGVHFADFALDIDIATTTGSNDIVAVLDVVGNVGSRRFAYWELRRREMAACTMGSGNVCVFRLYFYDPCFTDLEARVEYRDTSALRVFDTTIAWHRR